MTATTEGGSAFRRDRLPGAKIFFEGELGKLSRPDRRGWAKANCPFHKSKSRTSFSLNVETGAWCCFGCGKKGDQITFVRKRYGLTFLAAAERLHALDKNGTGAPIPTRKPKSLARRLAEAVVDGPPAQTGAQIERLRLREEIHATTTIQREVSDRLSELQCGAPEAYPDEIEHCWAVLSLCLEDLRMTEAGYCAATQCERHWRAQGE